ncbi:MAG: phosphatase PAP2 family protein [Spirochaetaceae bacterium]|jgi:membrane-associated phospholipid phosphatase|nr:phosphatase PAP2 family protein [Spirochaetaceae bacterium]
MNDVGLLSAGEARTGNGFYQWGLEFVRALQAIENPVLTALIKAITVLGSELFYVPVVLLVYWCINEKKGHRLTLLLLLSIWINSALKILLKQPRPYFLDPSVGISAASGYGFPSGHAQLSLVFWAAALSGPLRKKSAWLIAALITLVMGFTRLYLGLHFPTDLLGGWLIALFILGAYYFLLQPLEKLLAAGGTRMSMIAAAMTAFGMNALYPEDRRFGALLLGFNIGYLLMRKYFPFSASANVPGKFPETTRWIKSGLVLRFLRFAVGMAGGVLCYYGLKMLLGEDSSLLSRVPFLRAGYYELGRFLHYGLLGLWVSAGVPWLFLRLGLADPPQVVLTASG